MTEQRCVRCQRFAITATLESRITPGYRIEMCAPCIATVHPESIVSVWKRVEENTNHVTLR